ncbi:unnamed protein product [Prorocentrum cordatum]|uniref:glycerol kinase n=1 Tax=Prorocentrum cordatum TaxID=2364126 RepID=A0ABN9R2C0_9DINO|nr:unnamed protein product [Polarella glacialis]
MAGTAGSGALYLGVDAGTQGLKALVYDVEAKEVIGRGAVSYGLNPGGGVGCAEQDPAVWVEALFRASAEALQMARDAPRGGPDAAARVRGIGVSGQQHGLVALDASYQVLRPAKLWCDTQSAGEAAELAGELGWPIVASFTVTKLLWLKRNEPGVFARLAHVALPHDYLNYVLTGQLVMECGDASGTGMLDVVSRQWDATSANLAAGTT